jgi:hypothetical protein
MRERTGDREQGTNRYAELQTVDSLVHPRVFVEPGAVTIQTRIVAARRR